MELVSTSGSLHYQTCIYSISKGQANAIKSQTHGAELGWISETIVSDFHSLASSITVMASLPNIGGNLCSTPQRLTDAHYWVPWSNDAKTRNPLKFAGVPQTRQQISTISSRKFTILRGHVRRYRCLTSFFSDCRYMPQLRRYSPTKLCNGAKMAIFLRPVSSASSVQHISDMHSKFALRPHHVWKYGRHPISDRWD